jgi:hypothetical protein
LTPPVPGRSLEHINGDLEIFWVFGSKVLTVEKNHDPSVIVQPRQIGQIVVERIPVPAERMGELESFGETRKKLPLALQCSRSTSRDSFLALCARDLVSTLNRAIDSLN